MRTVTIFALTLLLSLVVSAQIGFAQNLERGVAGYCPYGCGPYVPLITTPSISFETVSPNPVGARNATAGLVAGATNSTLSEVSGNTDSVYTMPVWYSGGGTPLVSPAVNSPVGGMRMMRPEHGQPTPREHEAAPKSWVYFSSAEQSPHTLEVASAATGIKPAGHTFSNQDVERQNEKNGDVHYDSKTEKIR
jgi:hypothetical protein